MPRTRYASLLDDPAFVSVLELVEVSGAPADEGDGSEWFVEPPPPKLDREPVKPIGQIVFGLAGFLVMVGWAARRPPTCSPTGSP